MSVVCYRSNFEFQITILLIIPRLDIPGNTLHVYNNVIEEISSELKCMFLNLTRHFPVTDRHLLALRDSIHNIIDSGVLMFATVLSKHPREILTPFVCVKHHFIIFMLLTQGVHILNGPKVCWRNNY